MKSEKRDLEHGSCITCMLPVSRIHLSLKTESLQRQMCTRIRKSSGISARVFFRHPWSAMIGTFHALCSL